MQPFLDPPGYGRHRPEATLLDQRVQQHFPAFRELRAAAYLKCGRLEEGFLRVRCAGFGGRQKIIAMILFHLQSTASARCHPGLPLGARAPPAQSRLL